MALSFLGRLNGPWHKRAMGLYLIVVLAHWAEHLLQAVQIYLLQWPRPHALGALGLAFPWLVTSEWLHYAYAFFMLVGLAALRPAFVGRARLWWTGGLVLQLWHHFEHALLLGQVLVHRTLFGLAAPTSLAQLIVPRVELHLFYNAVVFFPMLIGMIYHLRPPAGEAPLALCGCARHRRSVSTAA